MIYISECGRYKIEENSYGKFYRKDGDLHRDGDLPACEYFKGTKNGIKMENFTATGIYQP